MLAKQKRDQRSPKIYIAFLIAILMTMTVYALLHQPAPQPDLECHEEQVKTMTIQQVSNLFDVSLVELTWLPTDLQTDPRITTHPSFNYNYPGLSQCEIVIEYPHPVSRASLVSIRSNSLGYIEETRMPANCSWNFTTSGPTGSDCSLELDGIATTLRLYVSISPLLDPDTILRILDGMVVVEPQNRTTEE